MITRRLSRSGDSDYFLNRAPCRLRDIADLLRGTGLGAGTGVVIESKMIDALLSDRPDDRRELFEEAAGVGLYRDRRRTTERRLEETTGDLQRLDDLINEVASQVRSLARQRKRAERHAEIMTRRFTVELSLAAREMEAWREELARLETRLAELRAQLPAAEASALDAEAARDQAHGARAAAEAQRNELSRLVSAQREQVQRIRGEMAVAEERQRNATARRQRAEAEATAGEQTGVQIAAERERAAEERAREEAELASPKRSSRDIRRRRTKRVASSPRRATPWRAPSASCASCRTAFGAWSTSASARCASSTKCVSAPMRSRGAGAARRRARAWLGGSTRSCRWKSTRRRPRPQTPRARWSRPARRIETRGSVRRSPARSCSAPTKR